MLPNLLAAAAHALKEFWRALRMIPFSYHPEHHYMRGPGPKWREKHPSA